MLKLWCEDSNDLAKWLQKNKKINWTSHDLQHEIIEIMAHSV